MSAPHPALDERSREVLRALIQLHVATGEPVGSETLSLALARAFSPPTTGVWWSIAIANTLNGLLIAGWFVLGRWKRYKIA